MNRREFTLTAAITAMASWLLPSWVNAFSLSLTGSEGFTLPALPYGYDALQPFIDSKTMEIHHSKHHAAYVKNLNEALNELQKTGKYTVNKPDFLTSITALPETLRNKIRNNGGGHLNHTLFWQMLSPKIQQTPEGSLAEAINATFGSYNAFYEKFSEAGKKVFGSGWVWLIKTSENKLEIISTANQDHPLFDTLPLKGKPIIGIDVWEHAYYLSYQNRRNDYLSAVRNVLNWRFAEKMFAE